MLQKSKIKYIQSLYQKKYRDQSENYIIEGNKIINTLLIQKPELIVELFASAAWVAQHQSIIKDINYQIVTEIELKRISALQSTPEVLAIVLKNKPTDLSISNKAWTLVLDDIQDPGNLGTIIRSAHWFGVHNIVCSTNTVDCYNPKVVQSSMGSIWQVNINYTNLESFLSIEVPKYVAVLNGTDIKTLKNATPGCIIIGNEGNGISEPILQLATQSITIAQIGNAESLNAAIATSIILSHLV
jgi:RNA methyltransferase, TrmH family